MKKSQDARLDATRSHALGEALNPLQEEGVLAVTHSAVSARTGISRSTLYRHWPKLNDLRNAAFARAATGPNNLPRTNGPLKTDLTWILGHLMIALNETPWGKIAPQVIAVAVTDRQTRELMSQWIKDRSENVQTVFDAAEARGELKNDVLVKQVIELSLAVPYFRKLVAGLELDHQWLDTHVDMICGMVLLPSNR